MLERTTQKMFPMPVAKAIGQPIMMLVMVLLVGRAVAQDARNDSSSAPYVFEKIETIDLKKKEIIGHANAFIAEKFVSAKRVIQLTDADLGKIVGDVILMNPDAGFFEAFKGIKTRLILDARDGRV
jgi:hypothetical protein